MEGEAGFFHGLAGGQTERSHGDLALFEIGIVGLQGGDARWTEEDDHVVFRDVDGGLQVGRHGLENDGLGVFDVVLLEEGHVLGAHGVGAAGEQVVVLGILQKEVEQPFGVVVLVVEDLALAELDVFLQVEGHLVGGAEVFHLFRQVEAQLLDETEEVINGGFTGEDDGVVGGNADVRLAELTRRDPFHTEKLEEVDVDTVFLSQISVGRLVEFCGGVLGNKDVFNLHKRNLQI